mmetsp:Transcript_48844/g.104164  ORF Transcript_48844/g.104164 Transcript_48844/m.104164 type:complete len:90 (-) Transcript_48844:118-387(-)|eukprot:CAMPEP_0206457712 /NCGR_PEP_ID=MMETSP0324_2-20121206/23131_1 /ASSEMBLY_ACC=CAM_ASM_000836 /TAXON_ID=2866 /ORGANISM="Crypthecodinium cohnii, Strain Seligo" /LENGTH=89 /DNA_ID=CAMNT_0053928899 /DNA_START=226 /DNA_END=495 /DNA_ORIENTATION=+
MPSQARPGPKWALENPIPKFGFDFLEKSHFQLWSCPDLLQTQVSLMFWVLPEGLPRSSAGEVLHALFCSAPLRSILLQALWLASLACQA